MENVHNWGNKKQTLAYILTSRGDHFRFGSVFIKKNNQTEIFFFKKINWNRTETGSNRPVSVRFGSVQFFRAKTGSNRFGSVFPVLAQFFRFGSVFPVWLGFGSFFSGFLSVSVRFFRFFCLENQNRTEPASFFKNLIGLISFFSVRFFRLFFFRFSRFNWFYCFFCSTLFIIENKKLDWFLTSRSFPVGDVDSNLHACLCDCEHLLSF